MRRSVFIAMAMTVSCIGRSEAEASKKEIADLKAKLAEADARVEKLQQQTKCPALYGLWFDQDERGPFDAKMTAMRRASFCLGQQEHVERCEACKEWSCMAGCETAISYWNQCKACGVTDPRATMGLPPSSRH